MAQSKGRNVSKVSWVVSWVLPFLTLAYLSNAVVHSATAAPANAAFKWKFAPKIINAGTNTALRTDDRYKKGDGIFYSESFAVLIIQGNYQPGSYDPVIKQAEFSQKELVKRLVELNYRVLLWNDLDGDRMKQVFADLRLFFGDDMRKNDRLFFYYFGHGEIRQRPDNPHGDTGYLVPVDAPLLRDDLNGFRAKAYSTADVATFANDIEVKQAFFVFESCYGGIIVENVKSLSDSRPAYTEGYLYGQARGDRVRQFLTPGNSVQKIASDNVFTKILVEAMTKTTSTRDDGYIFASDVIAHVKYDLPRVDKDKVYNPQDGTLPFKSSGDMIIGLVADRLPPTPTRDTPRVPLVITTAVPTSKDSCSDSILEKRKTKDGSITLKGIRLDETAGTIDWNALTKSDISFVYFKATAGTKWKDPQFKVKWDAAGRIGLLRGAFHVFDPNDPSQDQADNFASAFAGIAFGACHLPPALHFDGEPLVVNGEVVLEESGTIKLKKPVALAAIQQARVMLESIEQSFRLLPVISTSSYFWEAIDNPPGFEKYPLWVADNPLPGTKPQAAKLPAGFGRYVFLQEPAQANVPGIRSKVNTNQFNGTAAALKAMTKPQKFDLSGTLEQLKIASFPRQIYLGSNIGGSQNDCQPNQFVNYYGVIDGSYDRQYRVVDFMHDCGRLNEKTLDSISGYFGARFGKFRPHDGTSESMKAQLNQIVQELNSSIRRAKLGGAQEDWNLLGCRTASLNVDRDVILVGAREDRYDGLRILVRENDVLLQSLSVTYANGYRETYTLSKIISRNSRTPALEMDLPGERAYIQRIEFIYRSAPNNSAQGVVCVEGRRIRA